MCPHIQQGSERLWLSSKAFILGGLDEGLRDEEMAKEVERIVLVGQSFITRHGSGGGRDKDVDVVDLSGYIRWVEVQRRGRLDGHWSWTTRVAVVCPC